MEEVKKLLAGLKEAFLRDQGKEGSLEMDAILRLVEIHFQTQSDIQYYLSELVRIEQERLRS